MAVRESPEQGQQHRTRQRVTGVARLAVLWALLYAAYRAYYALGGQAYLPGVVRPGRQGEFQAVNLVVVAVLLAAAALPLALTPLWRRPKPRRALLALCWLIAVGCAGHATIDIAQRVLSLAGHLTVSYPASVWQSVDHRAADLQDLACNEPWFLIEGLLFAAQAHPHLTPRARVPYHLTAAAAVVLATAYGLLVATHVLPATIVG